MGALLVVLVAVSRSARDTAQEQVQAKRNAAPAVDEAHKKKMAYVDHYVSKLNAVKGEAERKLRDEHTRLSLVEDHIRRLQEKMRSLQIAAAELEAVEKEHYDDRQQAERETARLSELIEEARKTIETLQEEAAKEKASYAVVPYEGPNGTFRRPIYIECLKDQIVLQPEGVKLSAADLHPPYGPGNPLASVLRASRDHLVRLHPKEGRSRDTEPYPLLLVRSEGLLMFDRARQAIDAGDFDLGFELVEDDWKLKFPQPDPQLAGIQEEAAAQARVRQEALIAAAPRAYRQRDYDADEYGADDDLTGDRYGDMPGGDGYGGGGGGGGMSAAGGTGSRSGGGYAGGNGPAGRQASPGGANGVNSGNGGNVGGTGNGPGGSGTGAGGRYAGGTGPASGPPSADGAYPGGSGGGGSPGDSAAAGQADHGSFAGGASAGSPGGTPGSASGGTSYAGSGAGSGMSVAASDPDAPPELGGQQQNISVMMGSPPAGSPPSGPRQRGSASQRFGEVPADTRGKDWALRQKPQKSSPIRRTIRVEVREDQLAILPDGAPSGAHSNPIHVVPFQGDTIESLDAFVKQVRDQIDGWGIAGNDLYWRPVIILKVAPNGERRADDLARLLKNSGLELRNEQTANTAPQGKLQ